MIGGNHETELANRIYSCLMIVGGNYRKEFTDIYNRLRITDLFDIKILCVYGGLSSDLQNIQKLYEIFTLLIY